MQETCPNLSSEREVTGENGRRQASVDDCRQICTCRHYPCLHAQSSPPFFPVIPIRKVLPLKRRRRMSCRTHNFNVRDRSSGESIHFLFLHLCLFDAVLCLLSSQAIYCKERAVNTTGVCRQHNMWQASAHLRERPVQSCRYHIQQCADGRLAREMSAGQHRCLFGFGCYRCIMPVSAGYHKPPFYFLSTYLTEESKKAPHPCEAFRLTSDLLTQVLCSCTNSNN